MGQRCQLHVKSQPFVCLFLISKERTNKAVPEEFKLEVEKYFCRMGWNNHTKPANGNIAYDSGFQASFGVAFG